MTEYRVRRYRPELRSRVLALQRHHWGLDKKDNERYFSWKYEENPYLDEVLIYVLVADGKVAGMRGAIGARYEDGAGAAVNALCVGDLVIRPEDRAAFLPRRIMQSMAGDLEARGWRYLLSFSASRFTHLTSLRQGFRLEVEHTVARRVRRRALVSRLVKRVTGSAVAETPRQPPFQAFDQASHDDERRRSSAIEIVDVIEPAELADLCSRCRRTSGRLHPVRDEAFFAWRFRNPFAHYRFLLWREGSTLAAYLVLQLGATGDPPIALVDWGFTSIDPLAELVSTALGLTRSVTVMTWLGGLDEEERAMFDRAGLIEAPLSPTERYRPGLLVKRLGSDDPAARAASGAAESWRYRPIDSDGF
jgi:hypothetical protein